MDKRALDRYITSTPDDSFTNYFERAIELVKDEDFNRNQDWFTESDDCEYWMDRFFIWGLSELQAAEHITRIFNLTSLNQQK